MHPRVGDAAVDRGEEAARAGVLEFVRERGAVHPRDVDEHFAHGTVTNYWGGSSTATTHLLDEMHYRGLLRVTRREPASGSTRRTSMRPRRGRGRAAPREPRAARRRRRAQVRAAACRDLSDAREAAALRGAAMARG